MSAPVSAPRLRVVLAGATGWAGSALARGIARADDLALVGAVSRTHAGRRLGEVLDVPGLDCAIGATVADALREGCDVFVEYTKPAFAKAHVLAALAAGAHVVVGTSGLADADFDEIDVVARRAGRGVLAAGNFALTAVLLQKFAEMAARYIPNFEIVDMAKDTKVDAPSGTARELAFRLGRVRPSALGVPLEAVEGPRESRGATLAGVQVHAVRVPGFVLGVEAVFGMPDQRLHLRHEALSSAVPYVEGALLAVRRVSDLTGVVRGLDRVMTF